MSDDEPADRADAVSADVRIQLDRAVVWRAGWVVVAVVALATLGRWVLEDAGTVIFTLVLSLIASVAMEPAVRRLSRHMRRGAATGIVMVTTLVAVVGFLWVFGRLLGEQLATLAASVPGFVSALTLWADTTFDITIDYGSLIDDLGLGTATLTTLAQNLAGGLLGVLVSVVGAAFSTVTFAFFTFYFSADGPRLRRWVGRLVPQRQQAVFGTAWDLAVAKTGGYVSARLVLALISGTLHGAFMLLIGMPYWLALGVWTGLVAQFVPTVGTYVAIVLPVVVGLLGDQPWQGLAVLAFAVVYQQIENVTIEPRISAQAVDVHPAVSFASVMFGAALFGVAGAFVAVPVAALMLALFGIYSQKYELVPHLARLEPGEREPDPPSGGRRRQGRSRGRSQAEGFRAAVTRVVQQARRRG
ncbi:AI-2E family transporter [Terracoccus luteus]|uniref:Putative PurR-regulated permease PerM n=1 Tax=Terracoccus luteus TaxID=53356 RepID=A0A839PXZ4_9MICO|nr:AI-2E family transporter [Terracoccus luteus]MBB2986885.1 putative PurR-regulated permease PerM [Terracoccus luteus]MCP2172536.1 putative PurR-regulated permease PerM [Terracoccus luteus]